MSHVDRIARVRIELDNWRPAIWRRVDVPLTVTLKALHVIIQAVMPFENYHLFEFRAGERRYADPDPEWDSQRDSTYAANSVKLGALVDRNIEAFAYTYDFGDDWRHTISIKSTSAADPTLDYPRYIDGARRAPPEDVGGVSGFELFIEAMADRRHEQHRDMMRWYGGPFHPERLDEDEIHKRIGKIARRRALGKAAFAKSRNQIN